MSDELIPPYSPYTAPLDPYNPYAGSMTPPPQGTFISPPAVTIPPPPPLPGMTVVEGPSLPPGPSQEKINQAKAYFNHAAEKHTILRTGIIQFPNLDRDAWFGMNESVFRELSDLAMQCEVEQITGLVDYLRSVDANRNYSPQEFVSLIQKLVLGKKVSFPEIEMPSRLMRFIRDLHQDESLSDEAVLVLLINRLKDETALALYTREKKREADAASLLLPFQKKVNDLLASRAPLVDQMMKARDSYLLLKQQKSQGMAISDEEIAKALVQVQSFSALVDGVSARLEEVYADRLTAMQSRPDLFPEAIKQTKSDAPKPFSVMDTAKDLILRVMKERPDSLMILVQSEMELEAKQADSKIEAAYATQRAEMDLRTKAFQDYFKAKAEAELKFYTDQLKNAKEGYDWTVAELNRRQTELQAMQNQIPANIERLGGVLGWYAHENKIGESAMTQPYYMRFALQGIRDGGKVFKDGRWEGKYESHTFEAQVLVISIDHKEEFWKETPGTSIDVASETLSLMDRVEMVRVDFESGEGRKLRDTAEKQSAWMKQLQTAIEITKERVNSPEYVKLVMREFKATPEQAEFDARQKDIEILIRNASARISGLRSQMARLLDDLEEAILEEQGEDVPDVQFMPYERKKAIFTGAKVYLDKFNPHRSTLKAEADRILSTGAAGQEKERLKALKIAFLRAAVAEHVYRKLLHDSNFILRVRIEDEKASTAKLASK